MSSMQEKLDCAIPKHALNLGYALVGLSALVFAILLGTGVILVFKYMPDAGGAHASVRSVQSTEWGGMLRSIHSWSAEVFVVLIILHMTRIVMTKSFLNERTWSWFVGLGS